MGGPKFRAFFSSPALHFRSFFSLSVFSWFSGGVRSGPHMCLFSPSSCLVPAACGRGIFGGQRGLINYCFLTFWKVKSGHGTRRHNRKNNTNNKSRQIAQTTKSTKQQQHQEESTKRISKSSNKRVEVSFFFREEMKTSISN